MLRQKHCSGLKRAKRSSCASLAHSSKTTAYVLSLQDSQAALWCLDPSKQALSLSWPHVCFGKPPCRDPSLLCLSHSKLGPVWVLCDRNPGVFHYPMVVVMGPLGFEVLRMLSCVWYGSSRWSVRALGLASVRWASDAWPWQALEGGLIKVPTDQGRSFFVFDGVIQV